MPAMNPAHASGRFLLAVALVVTVVAASIAGCAGYVNQRLEAALREALPRLVGPAERYDVSVRGADAAGSRVDEVHAVGIRVQRPRTPVLARVDVTLRDVAVDRDARRVTSVGRATVALHLREQDMTDHLAGQRWVEGATVRFSGADEITVGGRLGIPGLTALALLPAEFRGRVVARGAQLLLRIDAITIGAQAAPALARRAVEQAINPIFDAAEHAVPSQIDAVQVAAGELVIRASGSDLSLRPPTPR